ncbi:Gfo/Idh/MocA family oxidoreductase [Sinomonas sp. JGH33]|uniref:Gfo/Idh/MocA family oxidoreductase n=1 Tax=Sinomonas terricola TaxID=3110330 RepID=A0ABU5T8C8_9MICC|nr:Gfo/Idh/MocA family oxidoreductase [Sinomonas sp. JGH33]MEA5455917.1 Gfo/Idh/MocA family oxidoreductase [Sinomonas sp. JGH33]
MTTQRRVHIAVAGSGLIGQEHLRRIAHSDETVNAAVCAVVDPAPAAREVAARHGVPLFTSLAELFAAQRPDGVILATPNRFHVSGGLECVAAGVPVLVEKPIAETADDAERLVAAADAAGVPLLVGHHRRHSPLLAQARRIVGEGTLGTVVAVVGTALFRKPDDYFGAGPWRAQPGGGPILINMIHEVDDMRALCGEIVRVQATASNAARGFAVEDTAAITLTFANGALGTFMLSDAAAAAASWEQTSRENPAYAHADDEDCYLIAGTRGSLGVPTMRLRTFAGDASWWEPFESRTAAVERHDPLAAQLAHFAAVVRGDAEPLVTGRDGIQSLRVVEAILEAARTGLAAEVPTQTHAAAQMQTQSAQN